MSRLSSVPLLCFFVLLAYACYGATVVGHWPHYGSPDPSDLPLRPLDSIVALIALGGLLSVLLIPLIYAGYRALAAWKKWSVTAWRKPAMLYGTGAVLWGMDITFEFVSGPWASLTGWILD